MINGKITDHFRPSKQRTLFDNLVSDPGPHLKAAMKEAISACKTKSRDQIVDEMNRLAAAAGITCNGKAKKITLSLLDKWIAAGSTGYQIPVRLLPVFCAAAGSVLPLTVYASFFTGVRVITEEDHKKLVWADAEISARKNRKRAKKLAEEVGI